MVYTIKGVKYYPVCSWSENQHKLYNAHDRAYNADNYKEMDELDELIDAFNDCVIGNTVYAPYKIGQKIKDYIWAYNARH